MNQYNNRYKGLRWTIVYGSDSETEEFAVLELNAIVQRCMPYVIECVPASGFNPKNRQHLILIGTAADNPLIAELISKHHIVEPDKPQGYTIACTNSAWNPEYRMIVVAGHDPAGVLYGTEELCSQKIGPAVIGRENQKALRKSFESLRDFSITDYPRIANRGIWTWGYVIYDYRQFIDNMARLKMNMLTIWNDSPPVNIREIISYAHSRGVKIVLGFHWGWGMEFDLGKSTDRQLIKEMVLKEFESNYSQLEIDGIYFQTLTEHNDAEIDGKSVAGIVCDMVNEISGAILAKYPELNIQFGLHATSIRDRFHDLANLDPRVTIVWEDAGTIPYSYSPVVTTVEGPEGSRIIDVNDFDQTLVYSRKLASLREGAGFAMVPKGWFNLDWGNEFEHHKSFVLGERHPQFIAQRLAGIQSRWEKPNELWEQNYHLAVQFYNEIMKCNSKPMTVTGLIEDGLFEARVQPSVAIFAETMWNPQRDPKVIRQFANRLEFAVNNRIVPVANRSGQKNGDIK